MQSKNPQTERRSQNRMTAVLPVRVRGIDDSGATFDELVHTLDLTPGGARIGSVHRALRPLETLVVFYRQRRMDFKVIWIRLLGKGEYQVGLQALSQGKEGWSANLFRSTAEPPKSQHASGAV